jgi:hypothetical protein
MRNDSIAKYADLITSFIGGQVDAKSFETSYLRLFKQETSTLPEEVFRALDKLFADVDAYCPDQDLCGEDDLNEEQLRERSNNPTVLRI